MPEKLKEILLALTPEEKAVTAAWFDTTPHSDSEVVCFLAADLEKNHKETYAKYYV